MWGMRDAVGSTRRVKWHVIVFGSQTLFKIQGAYPRLPCKNSHIAIEQLKRAMFFVSFPSHSHGDFAMTPCRG